MTSIEAKSFHTASTQSRQKSGLSRRNEQTLPGMVQVLRSSRQLGAAVSADLFAALCQAEAILRVSGDAMPIPGESFEVSAAEALEARGERASESGLRAVGARDGSAD